MLFSCLNLSIHSTNPSFSCCLVFIIIVIGSANERYGYVSHIVLLIDWSIESISFKRLLVILSYSGWSLIIFCIWLGQNSLNIIAYASFKFSSSLFYIFTFFLIFIFQIILNSFFPIPPCSVHLLLITFNRHFLS